MAEEGNPLPAQTPLAVAAGNGAIFWRVAVGVPQWSQNGVAAAADLPEWLESYRFHPAGGAGGNGQCHPGGSP